MKTCCPIAVILLFAGLVQDLPAQPAEINVGGVWVTNQGILELTQTDATLTGKLAEKTEVTGTVGNNRLSLQLKPSNRPTTVSLNVDASGWLSGEATTGRSTVAWFGCRQDTSHVNAGATIANFSGHWLWSWGIMQIQQNEHHVLGTYGADKYGTIEGTVTGRRLNLQWKRNGGQGNAWVEQSPDGKQLIGQTIATTKPTVINGLRASNYQHHVEPIPGEIVRGFANNGMLYHLRMPEDWQAGEDVDVVVLLHGSNFTTAGMVHVVASNWPQIAQRFAILGVQGENWAQWSSEDDLRFNYSYVSWVGRSTYKGFPFTDRESPALVMDLLNELDQEHSFKRIFVGGHSQGGFLTYMLHMHFPEQLAGSFPIAGGIPFQSEPNAFDDETLIAAQRKIPMLILHGSRDNVVSPAASNYAYQKFLAHGFPVVKLVNPQAGHPFDFLPIGDAIDWLDTISTTDQAKLAAWAEQQVQAEHWRDVGAAITRGRQIGAEQALAKSIAAYEAAASVKAAQFFPLIQSHTDNTWVDEFLDWQEQFAASSAAGPANEAFRGLATKHSVEAQQLESQATKLFREGKTEEGWNLYRQIVEQYYASPQYRTLRERVRKHFADAKAAD